MVQASQGRPARKWSRTKPTSDKMSTQTGTCSQRSAVANSAGVSARIIESSNIMRKLQRPPR